MEGTGKKCHIRRAAVLGSGVMGAQIAAQLTNANVETLLFDLPAHEGDLNDVVNRAKQSLLKLKPAPLSVPSKLQLIQAANYEEHLDLLSDCDFIIEAISERFDLKKTLYRNITPYLNEKTILASNTSGLSINKLAETLPAALRARFCGVHFFNPPRYMHLVELIPSAYTEANLLAQLESFLVSSLGKGIVHAKDTPNFIANRVGVFSMLSVVHYAEQFDIDLEIADALTGTAIGRPKSATFRTMDVVGLDTMAHVVQTMADDLTEDPWHQHYQLPNWLTTLIDNGALGQKTKAGIYRKQGKVIQVLDKKTGDYRDATGKADPEVLAILKNKDPQQRFAALQASQHPQAQFLWAHYRCLFHYCAYHLESIADTVRDVDLALCWGFGWRQGPFTLWQQAGWQQIANWLAQDIAAEKTLATAALPAWVQADSRDAVYQEGSAYAPVSGTYHAASNLPVYQRQIKPSKKILFETEAVSLADLGDEVAVLSFKSKMNTVGDEVLDGILAAVEVAEQQSKAMVLWQADAQNFSVGANLKEFAPLFLTNDKQAIDAAVDKFQRATQALRYSMVPTVAAVRGRALGGGCELLLHCDHVVAHLESYVGLVEVGVGLLPAGGGCKEFTKRLAHTAGDKDLTHYLLDFFKPIAMAEVSASAEEAKVKNYFRPHDTVIFNTNEVLYVAKQQALALAESGYRPPLAAPIRVAGRAGFANLQMQLTNLRVGEFISEYDYFIGEKIAEVICGGQVDENTLVDEAWLLKLERQAFVELAAQQKTQDRIEHILKTGKPLRN